MKKNCGSSWPEDVRGKGTGDGTKEREERKEGKEEKREANERREVGHVPNFHFPSLILFKPLFYPSSVNMRTFGSIVCGTPAWLQGSSMSMTSSVSSL